MLQALLFFQHSSMVIIIQLLSVNGQELREETIQGLAGMLLFVFKFLLLHQVFYPTVVPAPAPKGSAGFCLSVAMGQARIFPRGGKKHPVKAFFSADLSSMAYLVANFSSHHDPNSFCLHRRFRSFKWSVSSTRPNNSSLCFYGISGVGFGKDYGFHYFLRTRSET